jgi:hypothetical protein
MEGRELIGFILYAFVGLSNPLRLYASPEGWVTFLCRGVWYTSGGAPTCLSPAPAQTS